MKVDLKVNGRAVSADVPPHTLLHELQNLHDAERHRNDRKHEQDDDDRSASLQKRKNAVHGTVPKRISADALMDHRQ